MANTPPPWWRSPLRGVVAAVLALLASVTVVVTITGTDPPTVKLEVHAAATTPTTPASTLVDANRDGKRDDRVAIAPAAAVALDATLPASELASPLRSSKDAEGVGTLTGPLAADSIPGCRTQFVANFSRRLYGDPQQIWMHQTVSFDRPGYADQDALTALANRRSSGVSWALQVGGRDGLCTYNVPLKYSAWTQANANSIAIGIEVQAYGTEPQYCTTACRRTLMRIYKEIRERYPHIKMRRGEIAWGPGCRPIVRRTGIVEHSDGGACAGGHQDVTPWSITPLITYAAGFERQSAAARKRAAARGRVCNALRWQRGKLRSLPPAGKRTVGQREEAQRRVIRIRALKASAKSVGLDHAKCR